LTAIRTLPFSHRDWLQYFCHGTEFFDGDIIYIFNTAWDLATGVMQLNLIHAMPGTFKWK